MRDDDSFLAFVLDALHGWGPVSVRRMFGAAGLFRVGVMFGFVADETLYLKVADADRAAYAAAGSRPFDYQGRGRRITLSYWQAPAAALDDAELLRNLASGAFAAARAARRKRPRRKPDSGITTASS